MNAERIAHWTDCADRCDNVLRDRNTKLDNALCDASNMLREAASALSADRGEAAYTFEMIEDAWGAAVPMGQATFDRFRVVLATMYPQATPPSPAHVSNLETFARETYRQIAAALDEHRAGDPFVLVDPVKVLGWANAVSRIAGDLATHAAPSQVSDAEPRVFRNIREWMEHCVSAADEGEDYAVPRPILDALTALGLMEKVGRGKWSPTDEGEKLAAQPQPGRVEGWQLVPVEPTEAMVEAALTGIRSSVVRELRADELRRNWGAMIAAAPTAGRESDHGC